MRSRATCRKINGVRLSWHSVKQPLSINEVTNEVTNQWGQTRLIYAGTQKNKGGCGLPYFSPVVCTFCYTAYPIEVMEGVMEKALFVRAEWDEDAGVWVATSDDVPGLVAEADTAEACWSSCVR